ncbi:hypothetical protein Ppa06_58340 [Planomonospora parontospora subsp. parontospora]|uniref:Fibronectin type-III domain-containing protein n=2 Tax=Planomonospora parontospora TaxID=58119 RepID=A0AA37BLR3_9ACTN|nr:hypothetical protein GCM10010126_56970 [Planomonospora parontospora]GII12036.1 hypothetical protein Ppa06_58340 [Planomonospora parontospora subsp. parontospora]
MYDLRFVVHAPNGPRLGTLPHPLSCDTGWPLDDVPSLRLRYSAHALGADLLASPCEVAVEWSVDGQTWTEDPDSRFLRIKRAVNDVDRTGTAVYEMPGYGWQLRKVVLYPGGTLVDGKRAFLSATAGEILQTFLAEAQARGTALGLDWDFTPERDSADESWSKVLTIYYEPGLDALTTLINLSEQGVCDFRMQGRTLQVFNADAGGELDRDLASGDAPVDLRYGRDIVDAPDEGTLEDLANAVLVVGDDGFRVSFSSGATAGPWGRWETYVGQGGVSDMGTATLLAQAALTRAAAERIQRTRQITLGTARWLPWRDYRPGDRVLAPGDGGVLEPLRIRQITLVRDERGHITGNLILNDRFLERTVRLARRTAGIVGGSTAEGGSGARPAPEAPSPRTPAAPAGLIVNPLAYLDAAGTAQGQITATWGAVITDGGGVALTVGGYELFARRNETGAPWFLIAMTEATDTTATYSPLPVGQAWAFKVRAVNLGQRGPFSAEVAVTIPDDPHAPPVPSAPQLSTRLGVIRIGWDGLGAGGEVMPPDFHRLRIWMQDPLAPGWAEVGYLQAAGSVVVPGQPYGADREVRFTTVDYSGNESAPSPGAVIATVPLVAGDAAEESITTGNLTANAVTADKLAVGAVEAEHIAAEAVTAGKLEAVLTLSTRIVAGSPAAARVELNSAGLRAFNPDGVQTVGISAASGAVAIVGQFASGTVGRRIIINPAGAVDPEIRFYPGSGSNFARMYVDGDGSIIHVSGLSPDGTRRSAVIQRGNEWRAYVYDPATGLAGGGYTLATPSELEVGYNDINANLQRFRFTSAAAEYRGRWSYSGAEAGLIMFALNLNSGSSYSNIGWGATLLSVPLCVVGAEYSSGTGASTLSMFVRSRTTSNFGIAAATTTNTGQPVVAMIWAWRQ